MRCENAACSDKRSSYNLDWEVKVVDSTMYDSNASLLTVYLKTLAKMLSPFPAVTPWDLGVLVAIRLDVIMPTFQVYCLSSRAISLLFPRRNSKTTS